MRSSTFFHVRGGAADGEARERGEQRRAGGGAGDARALDGDGGEAPRGVLHVIGTRCATVSAPATMPANSTVAMISP